MSLAVAGLLVSIGAAVYGGYSSYQTAEANQEIQQNDATYKRQVAAVNAKKREEQVRKTVARGAVALAGSGVSLLSTTADEVFNENLEEGMFDAEMIRQGGEVDATRSEFLADQYQAEQGGALASSALNIGSTILTYNK